MNIYIFDIEVFSDDWIVIFRRPEENSQHIVIHNDNYRLREFLNQDGILLGGFNNKHYDNWIIKTMYLGGSNVEVKRHNDFIIKEHGNPWEFPFIQYKKVPLKTFDLRDDIADEGISLKAIEGNLKLPIIESSIPFDIDRKLTDDELKEVIMYCKHDVDSTIALYNARKEDYLDAKRMVGEMYGVPVEDALGLTNAKLSARVLEAKHVDRNDERCYKIPDNIDTRFIPKIVLDFFSQINDLSIPYEKLFGAGKGSKGMTLEFNLRTEAGVCPVSYAWGGVHGAKPCVIIVETEDTVIINDDVGSLYPNSMINFGFCSRSMRDPEAYRKLVMKRLAFKHAGDKKKANALKLVVNTVYGAMLNLYNDLADRWAGRSVCITNQLAMSVLITQLSQACHTIDFININTDGIMYSINKTEVETAQMIVDAWCIVTGFEMERDDFKKVIQKDVNNYIGIMPDGTFKTKGSFVSLYKGGNFKTNSLSIVHKAIVDYLVFDKPAKETIEECTDIFAFQQIVKTGGSYEGSYQYIDGKRQKVQKVNRIYAVTNQRYGAIVKGKWITEKRKKDKQTGKMISTPVNPPQWSETVISECPEHCFIDNENTLTVKDLDLTYYTNMAEKRIKKYLVIDPKNKRKLEKITEEVVIMPTAKKDDEVKNLHMLNVYAKLALARKMFQEAPVKKSGVNTYAEFKFFELEDIVPAATSIFNDLGLVLIPCITYTKSTAILVNTDNPTETIPFSIPAKDPEIEKGTKMSTVQGMGAFVTYMRRYLYMAVLDIVESDIIENTAGKEAPKTGVKKSNKPATPAEREKVKEDLIDSDGKSTATQIKAIKNGLKQLRSKSDDNEPYIHECMVKIKAGISKTEADELLIEIGKKVAE